MGRHSRRWGIASVLAAAAIVAGGLGLGLGSGTEPAAANGTDGQFCTAGQVTATMLVEPVQTMSQSRKYGAVEVTARPGQGCRIVGAPPARLPGTDLATVSDNSLPRTVVVTSSAPAWIELDWTREASTQQTPTSIVVDLGGGDVDVPWTGGGVDHEPGSGPVYVRSVQPGHAPGSYR